MAVPLPPHHYTNFWGKYDEREEKRREKRRKKCGKREKTSIRGRIMTKSDT